MIDYVATFFGAVLYSDDLPAALHQLLPNLLELVSSKKCSKSPFFL